MSLTIWQPKQSEWGVHYVKRLGSVPTPAPNTGPAQNVLIVHTITPATAGQYSVGDVRIALAEELSEEE